MTWDKRHRCESIVIREWIINSSDSFFRENYNMYNEKNGVASIPLGWIATTGDYVVK